MHGNSDVTRKRQTLAFLGISQISYRGAFPYLAQMGIMPLNRVRGGGFLNGIGYIRQSHYSASGL